MAVTEQQYIELALSTPDRTLELVCGEVREKPLMTTEHNAVVRMLHLQLVRQLDEREFVVSADLSRVRLQSGMQYVPDLLVIPRSMERALRRTPGTFEVYREALPLVVEVWSPSTGGYDVETKLLEYQQRGDAEIWRIHPYQKTLTAWRRQPDGSYATMELHDGTIQPVALLGVMIEIDRLFD